MRSAEPIRIELLGVVSHLSQLRPEWRLGQTLANLAMTAGRLEPGGLWDLEDEEALAAAKTLIEQYTNVAEVGANQSMGLSGAIPPIGDKSEGPAARRAQAHAAVPIMPRLPQAVPFRRAAPARH